MNGREVEGDQHEQQRRHEPEKKAFGHGFVGANGMTMLKPGTRARSIAPRFPLASP
jgi:hypothetical protein